MVHLHTTGDELGGEGTTPSEIMFPVFQQTSSSLPQHTHTLSLPHTYTLSLPQHSKHQLWSLAMHSTRAYQKVSSTSCPSKATELMGANGQMFPVTKSSKNALYDITVEENCHVSSHDYQYI